MHESKGSIKSDLAKVDATRDEDIDYTDSPELDDSFFTRATIVWPKKKSVTLRLDTDVLAWFKKRGKGYQTQINRLLRMYMEDQQRRSA